ncbi:MAG: SIMPL domain-containing protein [Methanomicrobiales archaeon]|nr:SIMPL domain-containing protein [Methanomicrobiales archaeon]MDI6876268.1 SIMPL domain-containing protein [Methanomicrobiales archaeon]
MATKRLLAVLGALAVIACIFAASAAEPGDGDSRTRIHVSGSGEVKTTPDELVLSVGVDTRSPSVQTAQAENAERMTAILDALAAYGIPQSDIKTSGYSIYPEYDNSDRMGIPKITQYRVSNTVTITTDRVNDAGLIIDLVGEKGATNVNYILFGVSDEKQQALRGDAIRDALQKARADADVVAAAAGLSITGIDEITVGGSYIPYYPAYDTVRGEKAGVTTPIVPGDATVTASVTVTYFA